MKINVVAFSTNGCRTALRLQEAFREEDIHCYCKTTSDNLGVERIPGSTKEWTGRSFAECDALVYIGAIGIAVRYIAPFIKSKDTDPAVVAMDEHGAFTVALLSGHIGGCNELTQRIADALGSTPVITTATDINGKFSVDVFATRNLLRIGSLRIAKDVSARVLDGRFVGFCSEMPVEGKMSDGLTPADSGEFGVCISTDPDRKPFDVTMSLTPMDVTLGIGCRRDTDPLAMRNFVHETLDGLGISPKRVGAVASVDLKKDEQAILELARHLRAPVSFYTSEQLMAIPGAFSRSEFVKSVTAVDCVCERSAIACGGEEIILRKTARDGMTISVAKRKVSPRFLR